ncbi:MAG: molybdopterin-dependent oxidoreductase [Nanoarchaeota archaeon]|nr:molybdopterin-dependent oxidoreductase [Nanoarchaeota archaeon]
MKKIISVCPFCGTGCSIELSVKNNEIVKVEGNKKGWNKGQTCIKGLACHEFVMHKDRLDKPLIKIGRTFKEVSWSRALNFIAENFKKYKGSEMGIFNSAKCTNEENFLMYELASELGIYNIDQCARLCHMPSGIAYSRMFGIGAMSCSYDDILQASTIMICGANPAEEHPVIFNQILKAKKNGAKIIVVDPRKSKTAQFADIYVNIPEGKDDALYVALCKYLIKNHLIDKNMLKRTENYDFFKEDLVSLGSISKLSNYCGIKENIIGKIAKLIKKKTIFINGLGLTESAGCITNVVLLGSLALLTGNIGKPGCGVAPLRGKCNVQGASDIQNQYYSKLKSTKKNSFLEKNYSLGLTSTEMIGGILKDQIKCLYILRENPLLSHPDLTKVVKAFKKIPFLVVQDIFMTETAKYADVILPGTSFAEKSGTFTNAERRIQLLNKAISFKGKPDWQIICGLGKIFNEKKFQYNTVQEVWNKLKNKIPLYSGITFSKLKMNNYKYPCHKNSEKRLYAKWFYTRSSKAIFQPVNITPPTIRISKKFPFRLLTVGILSHFRSGTLSRRCSMLSKITNSPYILISKKDAKQYTIKNGDIVKVTGTNGKSIKVQSKISSEAGLGCLILPLHFKEARVNLLTSDKLLDESKTPEFKGAVVNIKKI